MEATSAIGRDHSVGGVCESGRSFSPGHNFKGKCGSIRNTTVLVIVWKSDLNVTGNSRMNLIFFVWAKSGFFSNYILKRAGLRTFNC